MVERRPAHGPNERFFDWRQNILIDRELEEIKRTSQGPFFDEGRNVDEQRIYRQNLTPVHGPFEDERLVDHVKSRAHSDYDNAELVTKTYGGVTKEYYITTFRKALYSSTSKEMKAAIESLKITWQISETVEELVDVFEHWASNFLEFNDGSERYRMMKKKCGSIYKIIIKTAKNAGNKWAHDMDTQEGDTNEAEKVSMEDKEKRRRYVEEIKALDFRDELRKLLAVINERLRLLERE